MRGWTGRLFPGLMLAVAATGQPLPGAIVVYDFTGQAGNQVVTPAASYSASVIALDVARGPGLTRASGANSLNSAHWHDASPGDYVSFGFSVAPGYKARMTRLTFSSRSSSAGPATLAVRSHQDGFLSTIATWSQTGAADAHVNVDLSVLGDTLGTSEFRIFSTSNNSAGGGLIGSGGTWRLGTMTTPGSSNLLTIDGSVTELAAVPEPASWLLILTAACSTALAKICGWLRRGAVAMVENPKGIDHSVKRGQVPTASLIAPGGRAWPASLDVLQCVLPKPRQRFDAMKDAFCPRDLRM